jgi:hypothetical protein
MFHPEEFHIVFSYYDDMLLMLHDLPSPMAPFILIFKRWCQQLFASTKNLFYHVTVAIDNIQGHTWNISTARVVLSPPCTGIQPTVATVARKDLHWFVVLVWCIHPDLILREETLFLPEPEPMHVRGPPYVHRAGGCRSPKKSYASVRDLHRGVGD